MTVASAQSATYPDMPYTGPTPIPTFPGTFTAFSPPVNSDPVSSQAPAISEWTRINQPGDTLAISASGAPTVYTVYAPGYLGAVSTTNWFGQHGALTLPVELPTDEMYFLWPVGSGVVGAPVAINQTESWWLTEAAVAGGSFSIFGRNLGTDCNIWVEEKNQWLDSVTCNPYKADFQVPSNYANGTYTLWAHNGKGGKYGWAVSLTLTVVDREPWDENPDHWFDVTDYGAVGDGSAEDWHTGIKHAIAAASAVDWSTVYFPPGDYRIGDRIQLPSDGKIRLVGAGMDEVTIRPHSSFVGASYNDYLILQNQIEHFQMKDLTLKINNYGGKKIIRFSSRVNNVLFDSVRLDQLDADLHYPERPGGNGGEEDTITGDKIIEFVGSKNITMLNCEFLQKADILLKENASQIFVSNCTFIGAWDANELLSITDSDQVSVVDSVARNYDDTKSEDDANAYAWCQGRWIHGLGGLRNFYFGGNISTNMGPRLDFPDPNVGEQVMFEFTKTYFRGVPTSVTANTVTFGSSTISDAVVGQVAVIQNGKGQGQNRLVTALSGNTITLDSDWLVEPSTGSTVLIGDYARRAVIYDCDFDGRPRALNDDYVFFAAVVPYGGSVDLVVDNNRFQELRYAYRVESKHAEYDGRKDYEPNFFNLFMNGTLRDCYHSYAVMVERKPDAIWSIPQNLGNVFRNHDTDTLASAPILYHGDYGSRHYVGEQLDMQIFDNNTYTNYTGPKEIYDRIAEAEVINQVTVETSALLPPPPDPPPTPVLTGITISGSASVNEGSTAQYVCTADYSDGSTAQVAPNWSEDSNNADIDNAGVLSAGDVAADENMTVTASYGGFTDTHDVTIRYIPPVVLTGITISGPLNVDEETTAQYICTASYSDGTSVAVSPAWSENSANATINSSGLLSALDVTADQSVTISASFDGQTDTHVVTIKYVPVVLTGIAVSGQTSVNEETTAQYVCTASYSDGTSVIVTPLWSENSANATINSSGLLSALDVTADQSVTITASLGGQTDTHAVTILYVPPILTDIAISGPSSVTEETTAQYTCTANYSDGTSAVVTADWSENSAYTTISVSGLLSAGDVAADQNVTVTASYSGKSDTHTVLIAYAPPVVSSITISGPGSIEESATAQYVCTAHYSDGNSAQVNPAWTVNSTSVSIDGSGLLTPGNVAADEPVTVQASFSGTTATQVLVIMAIGDQVVYPLSGFDGKTVSAELWDDVLQTMIDLGEEFEPEEIMIENVNSDQWYWLGLREYDIETDEWVLVQGRWIWM